MRLDFRRALSGIAQAATGAQAGRIAGEQEQRRRLMEQLQREEQHDRLVLGTLDRLAPDSQRQMLENLHRRATNRARGRPSDYGYTPPAGAVQPTATALPGPAQGPGEFAQFVQGLPGPEAVPPQPAGMVPPQPPPSLRGVTGAAPTLPPGAWRASFVSQAPPERDLLPRSEVAVPPGTLAPTTLTSPARFKERMAPPAAAAPVVPPSATAAAPSARTFAAPSFGGTLELRGIDPKRADALMKRVAGSVRDLRALAIDDPALAAVRDDLLERAPLQIQDEAGFQAALDWTRDMNRLLPGLSTGAQQFAERRRQNDIRAYGTRMGDLRNLDVSALTTELPDLLELENSIRQRSPQGAAPIGPRLGTHEADIARVRSLREAGDHEGAERLARVVVGRVAARFTPLQEARKESAVQRTIGKWDLKRQVNPAAVRKAYTDAGLGYKAAAMSDDELVAIGRGNAETAYQRALSRITTVAGLSSASQKGYLENLSRLALFAGRPNVVPSELKRRLPPGFQQKTDLAEQKFQFQKERAAVADERRAAQDAAKQERAAAVKRGRGSVRQYATPQEHSEYNALNAAAWGPETYDGDRIYDESKMSKAFLRDRQAARARQNELVREWEKRRAEAEPAAPGKAAVGAQMESLQKGEHLRPTGTPRTGTAAPAAGSKATFTPGELNFVRGHIRARTFDALMGNVTDPAMKKKLARAYQQITGKQFGGK